MDIESTVIAIASVLMEIIIFAVPELFTTKSTAFAGIGGNEDKRRWINEKLGNQIKSYFVP